MREFWIQVLARGVFAGMVVGLGHGLIRRLVDPRAHPVVTGALQGACFGIAVSFIPVQFARRLGWVAGKPEEGMTWVLEALLIMAATAAFGAYVARRRSHE
ncbi:MAG TPA: hypothetical protein VI504_11910 [Candidatus Eisenbacteria bacterium]|jgi:drug/metabolite transporter (DMT)-like permease